MERGLKIGIGNLIASIFCIYNSCYLIDNFWYSDFYLTLGFIWFILSIFNLICFATAIKIFDLNY